MPLNAQQHCRYSLILLLIMIHTCRACPIVTRDKNFTVKCVSMYRKNCNSEPSFESRQICANTLLSISDRQGTSKADCRAGTTSGSAINSIGRRRTSLSVRNLSKLVNPWLAVECVCAAQSRILARNSNDRSRDGSADGKPETKVPLTSVTDFSGECRGDSLP